MSFNFIAAVTICSDFGAQKKKVSHGFPIYLVYNGIYLLMFGCAGSSLLRRLFSGYGRQGLLSRGGQAPLVVEHRL